MAMDQLRTNLLGKVDQPLNLTGPDVLGIAKTATLCAGFLTALGAMIVVGTGNPPHSVDLMNNLLQVIWATGGTIGIVRITDVIGGVLNYRTQQRTNVSITNYPPANQAPPQGDSNASPPAA